MSFIEIELSDSDSVTSLGFCRLGSNVAPGMTLIGFSGLPNASHSFPTWDLGKSCFGLLLDCEEDVESPSRVSSAMVSVQSRRLLTCQRSVGRQVIKGENREKKKVDMNQLSVDVRIIMACLPTSCSPSSLRIWNFPFRVSRANIGPCRKRFSAGRPTVTRLVENADASLVAAILGMQIALCITQSLSRLRRWCIARRQLSASEFTE